MSLVSSKGLSASDFLHLRFSKFATVRTLFILNWRAVPMTSFAMQRLMSPKYSLCPVSKVAAEL